MCPIIVALRYARRALSLYSTEGEKRRLESFSAQVEAEPRLRFVQPLLISAQSAKLLMPLKKRIPGEDSLDL